MNHTGIMARTRRAIIRTPDEERTLLSHDAALRRDRDLYGDQAVDAALELAEASGGPYSEALAVVINLAGRGMRP